MIGRVADHCFWLGRYIERAESTARHLQVTGSLALDAELPPRRVWGPLVIVSGQEEDFVTRFGRDALGNADVVQRYLTRDDKNSVSLERSIAAARENARSIREVVSLEVWQIINELYVFHASDEAAAMYESDLDALYSRVRRSMQLALGLLRSTMLHDAPLDFIWLGVLLERVSQTVRLLDVEHHALSSEGAPHQVLETALWLSLLRACSGFEAFMKRNRGKVTGTSVAAFLILQPQFPRSIRYCVASSRERLAAICAEGELAGRRGLAQLIELETWLAALAPDSLRGANVHDVLTRVVDQVHTVCDAVGRELMGLTEQEEKKENAKANGDAPSEASAASPPHDEAEPSPRTSTQFQSQ